MNAQGPLEPLDEMRAEIDRLERELKAYKKSECDLYCSLNRLLKLIGTNQDAPAFIGTPYRIQSTIKDARRNLEKSQRLDQQYSM